MLCRNIILSCVIAASGVTTVDPWNYNPGEAPINVEVLGAVNGDTIRYMRCKRTPWGWKRTEYSYGSSYDPDGIPEPDAWLAFPAPTKFPKLVEGRTKEQVERLLKEFDK